MLPNILNDVFLYTCHLYHNGRKRTFWRAPNEDFNQPAHPHSLIGVFAFRMKKVYFLGYPKCTQWRFWSECANAQADLRLRWAHKSKVRFWRCGFLVFVRRKDIFGVNANNESPDGLVHPSSLADAFSVRWHTIQRTTKPIISPVLPLKTQISLYINPVWQGLSFILLSIDRRL